jgi:membrane protein
VIGGLPSTLSDLYRRLTPDDGHNPVVLPLLAVGRWVVVFYQQLDKDQAFIRAAAMAYQSLIALVPVLLLVFGVLGATGFLQRDREALERLIFDTFIADIPEVREFIMRGIGDLDLTALGIIGIAGMVIFAGRLFLEVEYAYNYIFGTRVNRSWAYRLLNFYFALTLVPLLITVGAIGTMELASGYGVAGFARFFFEPISAFVLLLAALKLFPTVQVRWVPALTGAAVSTVGILGARWAFRLYLQWFKADDPLTIVYGTVGLLPVFLLWLYLLWMMVLLGVEVAFVAQNFRSLWDVERMNAERSGKEVRGPRLHTAIELLAWAGWGFQQGAGPVPSQELAGRVGLLAREVDPVLRLLASAGFLLEVKDGWALARPPERISMGEVVAAWRDGASLERGEGNPTRVETEVAQALERALPPTLADAIDRWVVPEIAGADAPS